MSRKQNKTAVQFWSAVLISDSGSCWEWQGPRDRDGYGVFGFKRKKFRAHRVAFGFANKGSQPKVVRHICDNPKCCNPSHLKAGSQKQNMADKVSRNRQAIGSQNGRSVLTEKEVKEIKWELFFGFHSQAHIARQNGVSPSVIRDINRDKTWTHVNKIEIEDIFGPESPKEPVS